MIIHSVTPLDMLIEQAPPQRTASMQEDGGCAEGVETPEGFMMTRLHSTNPALYLKKELSPGSILGGKKH